MAFVAINADAADSQVALQQSLQYEELRGEYDAVVRLLPDDLEGGWQAISALLDGPLFASPSKLPLVRALQLSALTLALDLAARVNPSSLVGLALEAVEWFPEEGVLWRSLCGGAVGSIEGAIVRRLALSAVTRLDPLDAGARTELRELNLALGRTEAIVPISRRPLPFGPPEPTEVLTYEVHLEGGMRLGDVLERICDLAEEVLEMATPKRSRHNHHADLTLYRAKLAAPIILVRKNSHNSNSINNNSNNVTAAPLKEDPPTEDGDAIMLSQANSIRNMQEYSQVSTRSQSRRLRGRDSVNDNRLTPGEFCSRVRAILDGMACAEWITQALDRAIQLDEHTTHLEADFYMAGTGAREEAFDLDHLDRPSYTLGALLVDLAGYAASDDTLLCGSALLATGIRRLAGVLLEHLDYFLAHASVAVLLWLAEASVGAGVGDHSRLISHLGRELHDPHTGPDWLIRLLWLQYSIKADEAILRRLEVITSCLGEGHVTRITGGLTERGCPVVNSKTLVKARARLEQAQLLESAQAHLGGDGGADWLAQNIADPVAWLASVYGEREFLSLAYPICTTAKDPSVLKQVLMMGIVKALHTKDIAMLAKLVELSTAHPEIAVAFGSKTKMLDQLLLACPHLEMSLLLLAVLREHGLVAEQLELIVLVWKDFLIPDRAHTKDSRFLTALLAALSTVPEDDRTRLVVEYAALRTLLGSPAVEIPDEWALIKTINEDRVAEPVFVPSQAARLFTISDDLVELENTDGARCIAYLDYLLIILLPVLGDYPELSMIRGQLASLLRTDICSGPVEPDVAALSDIPNAIREMLELKALLAKRSASSKRRSADALASLRREIVARILLEDAVEERREMYWQLGSLYDAELHLIMVKDAKALLESSRHIHELALGAYNCWRVAAVNWDDQTRVAKFVQFCHSMAEGGLSLFMGGDDRRRSRGIAKSVLLAIRGGGGYRRLQYKAMALRWLGKDDTIIAAMNIAALAQYLQSDGAGAETLYHLLHAVLSALLRVEAAMAFPTLYGSFVETVKGSKAITIDPECPPRESLLSALEQLGKLDKKRGHHLHLYTLALHTACALAAVKEAWGRLLPPLVRKSSSLVAIHQIESDYPGDHLRYADLYMQGAIRAVAGAEGDPVECATLVAMLIGRVVGAANVFVRRRRILADALIALSGTVDRASNGEFQGDRQMLEDVYADASNLVQTSGCSISH